MNKNMYFIMINRDSSRQYRTSIEHLDLVHRLSMNVLKTYVIQQNMFTFGHLKKCSSHAKNFLSLLATCCFCWLDKWKFF